HSAIEAEYVHELGLHESKTINVNPTVAVNASTRVLSAAVGAGGVPVLGRIDDEQAIGRSRYDGMNITYRQSMWKRFTFNTTYTLSKAQAYKGNAAAFRNRPTLPSQPFAPFDFGPAPTDERHHIYMYGTAELPWGFKVSPVVQYGSARPYDSNLGYTLGFGSGLGIPNIVVNNDGTGGLTAYKFNPTAPPPNNSQSALRVVVNNCLAAGTCHFLGFDSLRGQPTFQLDTRISKAIKLGEKPRLELMANLFNLTNRANYGNNFTGNLSSPKFNPSSLSANANNFGNPSNTSIPHSFSAEFGFRFSF